MSDEEKPRRGRRPMSDEMRQAVSQPWRRAFLRALADGLTVSAAAAAAKIGTTTAKNHRKLDPAFRAAWAEAVEAGTDKLEDEARRRAHEGWDEPIYVRGEVKGYIRRYSDRLLELLLKARRPEKFRENMRVEHAGKQQGTVSAAVAQLIAKAAGVGAPGAAAQAEPVPVAPDTAEAVKTVH